MKKLLGFIPIFVFLFFCNTSVYAADYYVSVADGNDTNCTGLSQNTYVSGVNQNCPWKTINKINSSTFSSGDTIRFKRGELWREQLTIPSAGASGNPITLSSYGEGSRPKIYGSDVPTSWTKEDVTTPVSITRVQGGSQYSNTSSVTYALAQAPIAGNLLVAVGWGSNSHANASIPGWTKAVSIQTTTTKYMVIFYKTAVTGESNTVTLNWTGSSETVLALEEWNGFIAPVLDQVASNPNTTLATSKSTGTTPTTTSANELIIAGFGHGNSVAGRSYSNTFLEDYNVANSNIWQMASRTVSQIGTFETTQSWTTSRLAGAAIATFKASQSGSTGDSSSIYYTTQSTDPKYLWFIDTNGSIHIGHKVASKELLLSDYDWWFDQANNRLYIYSATNPSTNFSSIEVANISRSRGIMWNTEGIYGYSNVEDFEVAFVAGNGIVIRNNSRVENNYVHHMGYDDIGHSYGIEINAGSNSVIRNNEVHDVNQSGIYIVASWNPLTASNNIIEHNTVYNCGNYLIWLNNHVANAVLSDNIIRYNNLYHTQDYYLGSAAGYAIELTGLSGITNNAPQVYYNTITSRKRAISINSYVTNAKIYNNSILSSEGTGIYISGTGTSGIIIKNNLVTGWQLNGLQVANASSITDANNNIIYSPTGGTYASVNGTNYSASDFNIYISDTGWDTNGLWQNPLITSLMPLDYRLQSSSPAINAGANVDIASDYTGITVPQGLLPDIGAYEFESPLLSFLGPTYLSLFKSDHSTVIPIGGWTNESSVLVQITMASPMNLDVLTPLAEILPLQNVLNGVPNYSGTGVSYAGSPVTGTIQVTNLVDGLYHWQAAIQNSTDLISGFSTNDGNPDFGIDTTEPTKPTAIHTPTWSWNASSDFTSGLSDPAYTAQWCNNLNFTECDQYTTTTNTLSYTHSTALSAGTWYFRVKSIDKAGNSSPYAVIGSITIE